MKTRLVDTKYLFEDFDAWVYDIDTYGEYGTDIQQDYIDYSIDYYSVLLKASTY